MIESAGAFLQCGWSGLVDVLNLTLKLIPIVFSEVASALHSASLFRHILFHSSLSFYSTRWCTSSRL